MSQSPVKPPLPVVAGPINIPTSPLAHHNYTWAQQSSVSVPPVRPPFAKMTLSHLASFYHIFVFDSQMSPQKHVRLSPRPSTSYAPYPSPTYSSAIAAAQHNVHMALGTMPNSLGNGNIRSGSIGISGHIHHSHMHHSDVLNLSHSAPAGSGTLGGPTSVIHRSPLSPNRRPRGENKKCRKQYGMEKKELWCTQCKWKKACSRFGD